VLRGVQKAARVTCISQATREALLSHSWVAPDRAHVVHLGVDAVFSDRPDAAADARVAEWLGPPRSDRADVFHVGSTIPRKRIDVLLRVIAAVRTRLPGVRLVRAGGAFTAQQSELIEQLQLKDSIAVLPFLSRAELAAVYRRAALVLQPSEAEGFGLPVIEAMACGAPVIASDIAALREVGGAAAKYCPVGDVSAWADGALQLAAERALRPGAWEARRWACLGHARNFTWQRHARRMIEIYRGLVNGS
jgi:glycosyltransferase involved in cell wall biosynthesis